MRERRRWPRAGLHWTIHVFLEGQGNPLVSRTENLSSRGFYCHLRQPVKAGERLRCAILIPAQEPGGERQALSLHCRVGVLRVEPGDGASVGIACGIEQYSVADVETE